jgi:hypothetical protein
MSIGQQYFITNRNNSFIGSIRDIDTNRNELEIEVNNILEGTIIDNYGNTLTIDEEGTFSSPFWRFYKIIGEPVNPNVLIKIDTTLGLNRAIGLDEKYLPENTKIYNKQGIFIGLLKDIGEPNIYLKYVENGKQINNIIGDLRDPNFSIYYNPTAREYIENPNLNNTKHFTHLSKLPEDKIGRAHV